MDKFYHSVCLDTELCKGCIHCLKRCPTQAIRVRNRKAQINPKFCIDCGECIRLCPHHAKRAKYDELQALSQYQYTIALPPPSLYAQFNHLEDVNIILNGLVHMGFDEVFEVSGAAELVSEATRIFMSEHKTNMPWISTACPTVVRLIRVKFPSLLPYLLPINPPIEVAAKIAVEQAMKKTGLKREQIGVFFITPCPSKVAYVKVPLGVNKSQVDRVLAIKDVYPLLLSSMKTVEKQHEDLLQSGRIGLNWGKRGGEASALLTEEYLAADGIENVIRVLEDLEDEKFENLKFVELNSCHGGCIGGVLNVENPYVAETKIKQLRKYQPVSRSHLDLEVDYDKILNWENKVEYEPVFRLGDTMLESFMKMNEVEKIYETLPGLDCGSCGAPDCRAMAEDMAKGEAQEYDCIHLLKELLIKKGVSVNEDSGIHREGEL